MAPDNRETKLIQEAVAGDRTALSQLLLLHHDTLQRHIARQIASASLAVVQAEDILQQTFVRAAHGIKSFEVRGPGAFRGWLKTIATNLIKDAQKRQHRERRGPRIQGRPSALSDDGSVAMVVERLAADHTPPPKRVQNRESIRRMRAALASLPEEQRDVIERYYIQNESLEQIAAATGRTKGAIRGMCYRARKNLRGMMGESSLYFSG